MISISPYSSLQLPTVKTVGQSTASTRSSDTSTGKTTALPSSRPATLSSSSALDISFSNTGRSRGTIESALREKLGSVLDVFYRSDDERDEAVDKAFSSLGPLIDDALKDPASEGIQLRLGGLQSAYGVLEGGNQVVDGTVTEFAIEAGTVRNGSVAADDVRLFGIDGNSLNLSTEERATGIQSGKYSRFMLNNEKNTPQVEVPKEIEQSLARMQKTQEILASYRDGDTGPLDQLLRGGFSSLFGSSFTLNA